MPTDPACNFGNWVITPMHIYFPNARSEMRWNETTDWLSIGGDRFILIQKRHAIIGKIDEPVPPLLKTDLYLTIPEDTLVRAWLLADTFLISPKPDYRQAQYLAQFSMETHRYYKAMPCLMGAWVSQVCVDPTGMYFVVYDYEDDYTVVYDSGMKKLGAWRCGSVPRKIEIGADSESVVVTNMHRWTKQESKQVILINSN